MRVIAVTGGASGIGSAVCAQLRAEGHRVLVLDRAPTADVVADLSHTEGRAAAVAAVREACDGVLDGLVCSAGLSALGSPTPGQEGRILATNYFGAVEVLLGLRDELAAAEAPAAGLVSSWGQFRPWPLPEAVTACLEGREADAIALVDGDPRATTLRPAYATSKIAMVTKVRLLAPTAEWAGAGITLNATVPGVTATAMTADRLSTPEGVADLLRRSPTPLGYLACAEDQADPIAYLASGRGRYICGQVICVDGGLDARRRPLVPIQPLADEGWT